MIVENIIVAVAVITNLTIAYLVYVRNSRSATHRLLAVLSLIIAIWSIVNALSVHAETNPAATWLVRFVMFFSTPVGVLFFLLMYIYPRSTLGISRKILTLILTLMAVTMAVSISPLLFPVVTPIPGAAPKPTPGIGMLLYVPVVVFGIISGVIILIRKFLKASGIERIQAGYLLAGVTIMFSLIIALLVIAVNVFETTVFVPYAPLFTLPFVGLTAYTIIRHRLMDVRLAIFRTLSLTFLIGGVLSVYGLLILFAVPLISDATGIRGELTAAAAALLSVPVARLIQQALTKITDKFLFQSRVDYQKALVKLSQELSGTIRIEEVTQTFLRAMREMVRSKKAVIMLREEKEGEMVPMASAGAGSFNLTIPAGNPVVQHLRHAEQILVKDELAVIQEQELNPEHLEELTVIQNSMLWLDVALIVPLSVNKELMGLLLLGDKLSGQPYLQEDVEFLSALAPQAATALENAQLYQQSLKFGERLRTEVDLATHELEAANQQLKDLDKAKSEFLSIASHQLYTPLTALRGYISMLMEGDFGKVAPQQEPVLNILEKSASRLIDLIKNLLDISRIESGRFELNLESVDLVEMAKVLVQDLMPNAISKRLKLLFEEPTQKLPPAIADQQRLRQVMLNFLDNAIKYTPVGKIVVAVKQEGAELVFSVTDTGKGLTAEEITKLFNKFSRVGGASRFHTEGTGLGLYVARQIIREHHGDVSVESPGTGHGSTFSMRVPIVGSSKSLRLGDKATVIIKAAESQRVPV
ncbi:MAG: ATP-binding protein [Candidatus Andersenbacteria bacterium]